MNEIRLENYRCFHGEHKARLAPLTLLVGENSTGKTSFLAIMRILSDIARTFQNPDFKEYPYDLGSFDEIAHHRGARGGRAEKFEVGFNINDKRGLATKLKFTFGRNRAIPVPVGRRLSRGKAWIDETFFINEPYLLRVGTKRGSWEIQTSKMDEISRNVENNLIFLNHYFLVDRLIRYDNDAKFKPATGTPPVSVRDRETLSELVRSIMLDLRQQRPFASAPVRSKPRRTYDPARLTPDPDGDYVPMYLADISSQGEAWINLRKRLQKFGQESGLFDEISIRRLGRHGSEPFQIQIRKFGDGLRGPKRNLIDVGYGVSQVLPVITEMLRPNAPSLFLLQQPEVHLHPRAQAALGSLFGEIAGPKCQIVVETHSDHLMDRVRMDIRDRKVKLKHDDISILYFERNNALDVTIHSLQIGEDGNILNRPDGYRKFFMDETKKILGL